MLMFHSGFNLRTSHSVFIHRSSMPVMVHHLTMSSHQPLCNLHNDHHAREETAPSATCTSAAIPALHRSSGGLWPVVSLGHPCLHADVDVYLLDDPLSAVDAHVGQHLMTNGICGLLASKTRVLVTHQLQFLPSADLVMVMSEGHVEELGTYQVIHEQLPPPKVPHLVCMMPASLLMPGMKQLGWAFIGETVALLSRVAGEHCCLQDLTCSSNLHGGCLWRCFVSALTNSSRMLILPAVSPARMSLC